MILYFKEIIAALIFVGLEKSHSFRLVDSKNIFAAISLLSYHIFITCILAADIHYPSQGVGLHFSFHILLMSWDHGSMRMKIWEKKLTQKMTPTWFCSLFLKRLLEHPRCPFESRDW